MSTERTARKITNRIAKPPAHVHSNCLELPRHHEYTGPVAEYGTPEWNPEAHGGDCITYVCDCNAVQRVNVRGDEVEHGPWHADVDTASYHLQVQAAERIGNAAAQLAADVQGSCDTTDARAALAQALTDLDVAVAIAVRPRRAEATAAA